MTSDVPETDAPRRKTIWVALGAAALVVVVVVAIVIGRGAGGSGAGPTPDQSYTGSAPATTGPTGSSTPTEASAVPSPSIPEPTATGTPTEVPTKTTATTAAPMDSEAALGNGVSVRVTEIESVNGEAQGPGEVAGPAIRVTLQVQNDTDEEVSMDLALVNAYYGTDKTPASALSGPGVSPLSAPIEAGESATGTYVFGVPEDQRDRVSVEFSYTTDAPTVIFSGKA